MSARRVGSAHNNPRGGDSSGGGGGSGSGNGSNGGATDCRYFPKFQPVPDNCQGCKEPVQHSKQPLCLRTHSLQKTIPDGQSEIRQIRCSGHPDMTGCCTARPPAFQSRLRAASSDGRRRGYRVPLGGMCSRTLPVASLIYKEPEFICDDAAEEAGEEEGEGEPEQSAVEPSASHSCPISSDSPEPRQWCCRRQSDLQQQHLQVLLQEARQPESANHTCTKSAEYSLRRAKEQLPFVAQKSAVWSRSEAPPSSTPAQQQPRRKMAATAVANQALRSVTDPSLKPMAPQLRRPHQQQQHHSQRQQNWQQQNQHHSQIQPTIHDHIHSHSSSPQPSGSFRKINSIYSIGIVESWNNGSDLPFRDWPRLQHQYILRKPLTGLLRSPYSLG